MAEIFTIYGMLDESLLQYSEEITDNDNEYTVAKVWRMNGEIVKRGVHVTLKRVPEMFAQQEQIGG